MQAAARIASVVSSALPARRRLIRVVDKKENPFSKTNMNYLTRIALALLLTSLSLATSQAQPDIAPQLSSTAVVDSKFTDAAKIAALEREVEVFREFTENILSTVYFSLGTVIVVLFAMVGFGWYQNFRSYERDKELLRQQLETSLNSIMTATEEKLDASAKDRFSKFDSSIAKALTNFQIRVSDVQLSMSTEVFQATHSQKTPETDLMVLLGSVQHAMGKVSHGCLNHALSVICEHFENGGRINSRPQWLELIDRLPPESVGYSSRLRELLAAKPS